MASSRLFLDMGCVFLDVPIKNYSQDDNNFIFRGKRYLAVVAGIIGARRVRLPGFEGHNTARAGATRPEVLPCF